MWTGCAKVYTHPELSTLSGDHTTVAVLPFDYDLDPQMRPASLTRQEVRVRESTGSYGVQQVVYDRLVRQQRQGRYAVTVQDIDDTNALLEEVGIIPTDLTGMDPEELADILGVDSVITGEVVSTQAMSDATARAMEDMFLKPASDDFVRTDDLDLSVTLHDGRTGERLWQYDDAVSGDMRGGHRAMADQLMVRCSKRVPFRS